MPAHRAPGDWLTQPQNGKGNIIAKNGFYGKNTCLLRHRRMAIIYINLRRRRTPLLYTYLRVQARLHKWKVNFPRQGWRGATENAGQNNFYYG
jgi:hypothetical protein